MRSPVLVCLSLTFIVACETPPQDSPAAASPPSPQIFLWSKPPVACVEEVVPTIAPKPCPDYNGVANPLTEWPAYYTEADIKYWKSRKRGIDYCRAIEVLKRVSEKSATFSDAVIEVSWMRSEAVKNSDEKIAAVYEASEKFEIPPQILTGALYQESLFSNLGIYIDGDNYSCGIGQLNIQEWCRWANVQSKEKKLSMQWPLQKVSCREFATTLLKPLYDLAKAKLVNEPEYKLSQKHFAEITLEQVISQWPSADGPTQSLRFQVVKSFIQNCQNHHDGIIAKARELRSIYDSSVPPAAKVRDYYETGESYDRVCLKNGYSQVYPLHFGWLMAVGMYNAGPRMLDLVAHYFGWTSKEAQDPEFWASITPLQLIEAIYWSGRYDSLDDKMHFKNLSGQNVSWVWNKQCVLQRHIARVMQNVALPGVPSIAQSLEGKFPCAKSEFDPKTGQLIKSAVPPLRQISSGQKIQ